MSEAELLMTIAKNRLMTLDEYLNYKDGSDAYRYELADGVLVEMPSENPLNSTIVSFLVSCFLKAGVSHYHLAIGHQIQVESQKASARQPDLIVHSEASVAAIFQDGKLLRLGQPEPKLVVEVVSSSDTDRESRDRDYIHKRKEYEQRGIPEYWIVDPVAAVVLVMRLVEGRYVEEKYQGAQRLLSKQLPSVELSAMQIIAAGM